MVRHILLSLVLGIGAGTFHFRYGLTDQQAKHLVLCAEASARVAAQSWRAEVFFPKGPKQVPKNLPSLKPFRKLYGERTLGFLAKQWGTRVGGWLTLCLVSIGAVNYGRQAMQDHRLRSVPGANGRCTVRGLWQRLGWATAFASFVATAWTIGRFDEPQRAGLTTYVWAASLETSPPLARMAAPGDKVGVAWFAAPLDIGFHNTASVYAQLHDAYGHSVAGLCSQWLGRLAVVSMIVGGLTAAYTWGHPTLRLKLKGTWPAWQHRAMRVFPSIHRDTDSHAGDPTCACGGAAPPAQAIQEKSADAVGRRDGPAWS